MSTVTESLTAAHAGIKVLGISMITNMAAGINAEKQSGDDVIEAGKLAANKIAKLITELLKEI